MANDEKADQKAGADEAPKKSKKKLIMIIAIVVVLLGGGAGGYLMLKPSSATAEPEPEPGIVVPLDAITINLADGHFLKLKLSLQATADVAEAPDGSKALDIAIDLYSNREMAELMSNQERERSKAELKEKIEAAYTVDKEKEIMDVYFTSFVIQ
ncbi:flagellar basal body-associated FliL family protein [Dactylosporangium aurantiacum]|uniref:Flagellar protein FliL n=1 Tax=Dactylosporangium aurantiacum TaxID=35754 RepID=A0A9Q9IFH7_9ACTN|nr:flagellar basal body-associated FliL family protein [Dactylosporangium aurantiacum]MDG6102018.1 flagellar basal body-associated FliL family protein [Dactylosporangium aurantiacum]UWZ53643.1 flagellar basal body-associated FliL family protein [Dactylosporangium aurantiacum]